MKSQSLRVRVCSMLFAVLASALVLGATVVGMQPDVGAGDVLVAVADLLRAASPA